MSYWRDPPLNVHIEWFFIIIIFLVRFVGDRSCQNILKDGSPRVEDIIDCIPWWRNIFSILFGLTFIGQGQDNRVQPLELGRRRASGEADSELNGNSGLTAVPCRRSEDIGPTVLKILNGFSPLSKKRTIDGICGWIERMKASLDRGRTLWLAQC
jgi:hypothetical protein